MLGRWMRTLDLKSFHNSSGRYNRIPSETDLFKWSDNEAHECAKATITVTQTSRLGRVPSLFSLITFGLFFALASVSALYINLRAQIVPPPRLDCGNSLATAHARGCSFDQMSKLWMPPGCPNYGLDQYMSAASSIPNNTDGNWHFYRDRYPTSEMSVLEMADMADMPIGTDDNRWFTTDGEHIVHCTWLLIRMAHAYNAGQRRDGFGTNFHHSKHCASYLMDHALQSPDVNEIRTSGSVGFGWC